MKQSDCTIKVKITTLEKEAYLILEVPNELMEELQDKTIMIGFKSNDVTYDIRHVIRMISPTRSKG